MISKKNNIFIRESVYNSLKRNITLGELKPGERLLEWELADRFRVSRTPIREAMRQLQSEGLVKVEPLKGATVTKLSVEEVKEIFWIRNVLESYSTELAVKNFGSREKEKLKEFRRLFNKYARSGDYLDWLETNVQFHLFIAKNSGNSNLHVLLRELRNRVHRYQFIAATSPDIIIRYTKEHEKIIEAALEGNPKLARKNMEKHLKSVHNILTDFLKKFPMM